MSLSLGLRTVPARATVTLAGEVDNTTAGPMLAFLLAEVSQSDRDLVIDLRDVTFVDAAGLGAFVAVRQALDLGSRALVVRRATPSVMRLFALTGLDEPLGVRAA